MRRLLLTAAVSVIVSDASAADAPFGFEKGADPLKYGCTEYAEKPGYFRCNSAPRSHPDIDFYVTQSEPGIGICWVKGVGKDIKTSRYGESLRLQTDKIAEQVGRKYGKSELTDHLRYGSIWDDPQDWTMGLNKNERWYSYQWQGGSTLAEYELATVYVGAVASNSGEGYVVVEFSYTNEDECEKTRANKDSGAF